VSARREVVVVGAGQAGLAMGHYLAEQGRDFVVLESADRPAATWRDRWDSLVLFTPVRRDSLPGKPFPGDPDHYPTRDEVVAYLEDYARDLPVELNSRVTAVRQAVDGYVVEVGGDRSYEADQVVIATGPFQVPFIPEASNRLGPDVVQMHSTEYRNPESLPGRHVLVVGGGNTGFQIAEELAASGREVHLAVGSRQMPLPQRFLGRDLFRYLEGLGLMRKHVETRLGSRMQHRDFLIGSSPRGIRRRGVQLHPRVVEAAGSEVTFSDGERLTVDAVVWATGFRVDHSWIDAPVFDDGGRAEHRRGVTSAPGLYFLGLQWLYTRGSALLGWVHEDARHIADQIASYQRTKPAPAHA
jgi:putative flavoprotein involved in K+ transport